MLCSGFKPTATGCWAQLDPLRYGLTFNDLNTPSTTNYGTSPFARTFKIPINFFPKLK